MIFNQLPPRFFLRFFRWYCHPNLRSHIEGDLIEDYNKRRKRSGKFRADARFVWDVILLIRPGIIRPTSTSNPVNQFTMFKNYFTVALRVFNRERLYSLINVLGLALGLASCLLLFLFIRHELSYDRFHQDGDRIYRVAAAYMRQSQWEPYATNAWKTAELVKTKFTEVEQLVRISGDQLYFESEGKRIYETRVAYVDSNFLDVFTFPLVAGNEKEALKGTNKVIISESVALKYFGTTQALGKIMEVDDRSFQVVVSGVMKDMPGNSHFHFDVLISGETLRQVAPPQLFNNVGWDSQVMYIKVSPGTDVAKLEAMFPDFINNNLDFWKSTTFKLFLQPLHTIHLYSNIGLELEPNGSMSQVYIFSAVALFLLLIACINYMNLTTARSLRRAKEVGMRKTLGAKRSDLISQFLSESVFLTFLAVLIAVLINVIVLPKFNVFAGKNIPLSVLYSKEILTMIVLAIISIGLMAGVYPSFVLSSFRPLNNLKGVINSGKSGLVFRRGLVVIQFALSIGLIAASGVIFQQWKYLRSKELGIDKDMLVAIPLQNMDRQQIPVLKNEWQANAAIKNVAFSNMRMPGWISNSTGYSAEGVETDDEVNKSMKIIRVDFDFLQTIKAEFKSGRNFSLDFPVDTVSSIILNESAVAQLGWTDPIGKWMDLNQNRFYVVGVVKDFHFESLYRKIPPTIFIPSPVQLNWAYVKVEATNRQAALEHLEKAYLKFVTNRDFTFTFVEDDLEQQYIAEEKFTEVFTLFTSLAIIIACLGTFGLISFTAERKAKEIGIRKVLGASTGTVSFLLIKEFIILLIVASVIALPATWYYLSGWMERYVYHTTIGALPFVEAVVLAAIIVVLTTGFRALKAAMANPVNSLRDE